MESIGNVAKLNIKKKNKESFQDEIFSTNKANGRKSNLIISSGYYFRLKRSNGFQVRILPLNGFNRQFRNIRPNEPDT